jgi:dihydroorotase
MAGVFRALLLCSDGDCAEVFEAYGSLEELEALACDCGCSLELLEVSELAGESPRRGFDLVPVK